MEFRRVLFRSAYEAGDFVAAPNFQTDVDWSMQDRDHRKRWFRISVMTHSYVDLFRRLFGKPSFTSPGEYFHRVWAFDVDGATVLLFTATGKGSSIEASGPDADKKVVAFKDALFELLKDPEVNPHAAKVMQVIEHAA